MSREYLMWKNRGRLRFRMPGEVVTLSLNPGREHQLYTLIAGWLAQDGLLGEDGAYKQATNPSE